MSVWNPRSQRTAAIFDSRCADWFGSLEPTVSLAPTIPEHELLSPIAQGAYGEVWLARNVLGSLRAVKVVRRDRHAAAESFKREFKGLEKFERVSRAHDGLVDILTLGLLPDGVGFYYVMELADNAMADCGSRNADFDYQPKTLRAQLKTRGAWPADEVIALGLKLAAALAHLHANGLVHRDVKPSNILFIGGEPKLADAGLVADMDDARSLVGTAGYIAPEGPGTPGADLYALGKVLYEAAFGKDRKEFPVLPADVASRPDHIRLLELNEIIARACAPDPKQRYARAEALQSDLELLRRGNSIRRKRLHSRYRAVSRKAALILTGAVIIAMIGTHFLRDEAIKDAQSKIPHVNKLVADGNVCLLSSTPERLKQALAFFEEAIEYDPGFVPARFGVFGAYVALGSMEGVRASAPKLMEVAPNSAEAHVALAYQLWIDWRFQEALRTARRATELPAYTRRAKVRARLGYGFQLLQTGQPQAALTQYRIAGQIAEKLGLPDPTLEHHLGHPHLAQRNFAEALKHYNKSIELEPRHLHGYYWKAATYEEMEQFEKAVEELKNAFHIRGDKSETEQMYTELREAARGGKEAYWRKRLDFALKAPEPDLYDVATIYARLENEKERAYEYLRKACKQRSFTQNLMFDLCWDHNDPEFQAIARGIGILP